jgi:hypothetical protein
LAFKSQRYVQHKSIRQLTWGLYPRLYSEALTLKGTQPPDFAF